VGVLVLGASGFIGAHAASALRAAGHEVVLGVRDPANFPGERCVAVDFERDHRPEDWLPRLQGIDCVINAVGILRERGAQTFVALHERAPQALFSACAACRVRVVQVSALGADASARSRYHRSKKRADDYLATLGMEWVIVQPSLVFGAGGASARLFCTLAALPLIPLPGGGGQRLQPIHVDDVAAALVQLAGAGGPARVRLALVGAREVSLREWLATLRAQMGLGRARFFPVPMPVMRLAAALARLHPAALLDSETLDMLERGSVAPAAATAQLLGRPPRGVEHFLKPSEASAVSVQARLAWLLPLLRASLAIVWLVSGIVSLGPYPIRESLAMLERVGLHGALALAALYGAAVLDIGLGLATWLVQRRRWLWRLQIAVVLGYSAIIALKLPELWLHPFGPLVKNLPILAALVVLHELEPRRARWNT
jgi:uncharacterized protein YbjT (DUF2867 family)